MPIALRLDYFSEVPSEQGKMAQVGPFPYVEFKIGCIWRGPKDEIIAHQTVDNMWVFTTEFAEEADIYPGPWNTITAVAVEVADGCTHPQVSVDLDSQRIFDEMPNDDYKKKRIAFLTHKELVARTLWRIHLGVSVQQIEDLIHAHAFS